MPREITRLLLPFKGFTFATVNKVTNDSYRKANRNERNLLGPVAPRSG